MRPIQCCERLMSVHWIHLRELHDQKKTRWWKRSKVRVAICTYARHVSVVPGRQPAQNAEPKIAETRLVPIIIIYIFI